MIGYLTTNNAFDTFVITDGESVKTAYTIDGAQSFRDALLVGGEQCLRNWTGAHFTGDLQPADFGEVIAVNDGDKLEILNRRLFDARRTFWCGE